MQTVRIDKRKNPDIADFAADVQPGDPITLHGTVKSNDDQAIEITVNEVGEGAADSDDEDADTAKPSKYGAEMPEEEITDNTPS